MHILHWFIQITLYIFTQNEVIPQFQIPFFYSRYIFLSIYWLTVILLLPIGLTLFLFFLFPRYHYSIFPGFKGKAILVIFLMYAKIVFQNFCILLACSDKINMFWNVSAIFILLSKKNHWIQYNWHEMSGLIGCYAETFLNEFIMWSYECGSESHV